ncbi:uncharacterized protein LOC132746373 [Ruditapes philippinarum]|uniref:uncharacterized protein LOC132746373 n=1 Tax=Ruditapes philippinarum TaxID=129788 RepID=UPI00295BF7E5|nr:uncharacterized protein LOC132746373 [Ruditapes philippinarum]
MLIGILTLLFCFAQPAACNQSLSRLNYGIVFKEIADLHLANEHWIHTFELPIPDKIVLPTIGHCHRDNETCIMVSHVLAQINTIRAETSVRMDDTIDAIKRLIPETRRGMERRRRSLLPFIGQLSKSIFGTATSEDVNMLARHVNALTRKTYKILNSLEQHGNHLSSFMQTANKRMDNLLDGIKTNKIEINYIHNLLMTSTKNLQYSFSKMLETLASQINQSSHLNHLLDEYKNGIVSLAEGELSPIIIPSNIMQQTMSDIQNLLSTKYSGFHLTYKNVNQVYSQSKFVCGRFNNSIYISVKFPITVQKQPIKLYRVLALPVPVNSSSTHATQILDLPYYFAITSDRQYYMALNQNALLNCHGTKYIHCYENKPLTPVTSQSCALSLFSNDKELIHSSCNFRFVQNVIKPNLIELDSNAILLYRTPLLSVECKHQHKMIKGCDFCIIKLPCQCSVITSHIYLPQRLIACHNETNDISIVHHVNLILLQKFFDKTFHDEIFADSSFGKPVNVSLPKFKLFEHKMHSVLANDAKAHLNLSRMVDLAKQDTAAFQSLTEPLLDGLIDIQSEWPNLNSILIFSTMGVTAGLFLSTVWSCIKIKKLLVTVTILKNVQTASALPTSPIPSFIYKTNPKPTDDSSLPTIYIDLTWEHAILFVCLLHFAFVLFTVLKKHYYNRKTILMLELTTGDSCIILPVLSLPLCPAFCKIRAPSDISHFKIRGPWYNKKLNFSWPDFNIEDSRNSKALTMPDTVNLTFMQSLKVRKMIKKSFFVYVYIQHKGHLIAVTSETFGPNFTFSP